jgi:hypothetical protein
MISSPWTSQGPHRQPVKPQETPQGPSLYKTRPLRRQTLPPNQPQTLNGPKGCHSIQSRYQLAQDLDPSELGFHEHSAVPTPSNLFDQGPPNTLLRYQHHNAPSQQNRRPKSALLAREI